MHFLCLFITTSLAIIPMQLQCRCLKKQPHKESTPNIWTSDHITSHSSKSIRIIGTCRDFSFMEAQYHPSF